MREDLLKELEAEYAERRAENERTEAMRAAEIRDRYPMIYRLKEQRQELVRSRIRTLGTGMAMPPAEPPLPQQVEEVNRKIRESLKEAGLPEDYLAPVYHCSLCRDTGYTGELIKQPCSCLTAAYRRKFSERNGLAGGRTETFETFSLDMIPDEKENGQRVSQRDISRIARNHCEKWANQYPENEYHTIVLSGESGLGKTFLMHAMAARLTERGFSVLIISAYQFLQTARRSFFENDEGMDELIQTPILMMDDLGSEPLMKNITIEALYVLINERQNRGLPTVLSTNLDMSEFTKRYTERIGSRINNARGSLVIVLRGKDLRKIGGAQR